MRIPDLRPIVSLWIVALALALISPGPANAGGTCVLHPQPFTLRSDSVRWSMRIKPGAECIQGLRWSTILIDKISIVEPPKHGRLVVQGPAFRYFADADSQAADFFKISISGTSLQINGTSVVEVDVSQ